MQLTSYYAVPMMLMSCHYFIDSNIPKLVADQKIAFDNTVENVENNSDGRLFFLDGHVGASKNFLANLMLVKVRQSKRKALAMSSFEIVATVLNDVKTALSIFKLLLAVSLEQRSAGFVRKNPYRKRS